MFKTPTLLVLGAGASCDFGYPLATGLRKWILEITEPRSLDRFMNDSDWETAPRNNQEIALGFLHFLFMRENGHGNVVRDLHESLSVSNNETIDRFLRSNPRLAPLGKALIAFGILRCEFDQDHRSPHFLNRKNKLLLSDPSMNWYKRLLTKIQDGCDNPDDLRRNKLSVLTFNYDCSFEAFLQMNRSTAQIFDGVDYEEFIQIKHVYGKVESPPESRVSIQSFYEHCLIESENIRTIGENAPKQSFFSSHSPYADAERVFFMGFGFDTENIDLLRGMDIFESFLSSKEFFALNYDGHLGIQQRVEEAGIEKNNTLSGTRSEPMGVADALDFGFLR